MTGTTFLARRKKHERALSAESASILDRFVRLTDFERLTIERRNEDFPCRSSPSSLALSQLQLLEKIHNWNKFFIKS